MLILFVRAIKLSLNINLGYTYNLGGLNPWWKQNEINQYAY